MCWDWYGELSSSIPFEVSHSIARCLKNSPLLTKPYCLASRADPVFFTKWQWVRASSWRPKTRCSGWVELVSLGWLSTYEKDNSDSKPGWVELVSLGRQSA